MTFSHSFKIRILIIICEGFPHLRIFPNILTCEWVRISHRLALTVMLVSWCKHAAHCIDILYLFVKSRKKYSQSWNFWGKIFQHLQFTKNICPSNLWFWQYIPELFFEIIEKTLLFWPPRIGILKPDWWGFEVSTFLEHKNEL